MRTREPGKRWFDSEDALAQGIRRQNERDPPPPKPPEPWNYYVMEPPPEHLRVTVTCKVP